MSEVLMQCLACCKKRLEGISTSRSNGRAPLTETEYENIYDNYGFCRREHCQAVRHEVMAYPPSLSTQFDNIFTEYLNLIDAFFSPSKGLSRTEFIVKRSHIKKAFSQLRRAAGAGADSSSGSIASHMQVLVNNYIHHVRASNADH